MDQSATLRLLSSGLTCYAPVSAARPGCECKDWQPASANGSFNSLPTRTAHLPHFRNLECTRSEERHLKCIGNDARCPCDWGVPRGPRRTNCLHECAAEQQINCGNCLGALTAADPHVPGARRSARRSLTLSLMRRRRLQWCCGGAARRQTKLGLWPQFSRWIVGSAGAVSGAFAGAAAVFVKTRLLRHRTRVRLLRSYIA